MPHILLVEDSLLQGVAIKDLLEGGGHRVDLAVDGKSALARIETTRYDLVLSDFAMPGMNGCELRRQLRADLRTRTVPFLLHTVHTGPAELLEAMEAGVDGFLRKPADPARLLAAVGRALDDGPAGVVDRRAPSLPCAPNPARALRFLLSVLQGADEAQTREARRRHSMQEAVAQELVLQATIDRLPDQVTILDETGQIELRNQASSRAAEAGGCLDLCAGIGTGSAASCQLTRRIGHFQDRGRARVVVCCEDETERFVAEQAREAEARRLAVVLDAIPAIVWSTDRELRFKFIGGGGLRVAGVRAEDITGRALQETIPPDQTAAIRGHQDALAGVSSQYDCVVGGCIYEASVAPLHDAGGGVIGCTGLARDITDRRRLETRLRALQGSESMGLLAARVAHEVNNPLTYVQGHLEGLGEEVEALLAWSRQARALCQALVPGGTPWLSPGLVARLDAARDAAQRVQKIARELKTFAHFGERQAGTTLLVPIVRSALTLAANQLRFRAEVTTDLAHDGLVAVSPGLLAQAVLTVLILASEAVGEGAPRGREIRVETRIEPDRMILAVGYPGLSLSSEALAGASDSELRANLGLVRDFAAAIGGGLSFELAGAGREALVLRLPMAQASPTVESPEPPAAWPTPARPAGVRARILVVDDEPLIARMIHDALAAEHDVLTAAGVGEALRRLEGAAPFDLLLSDLRLGDGSGWDLLAWVQEHPEVGVGRFAFVTGGALGEPFQAKLARLGVAQIEKPFTLRGLRELVASWLPAKQGAAP